MVNAESIIIGAILLVIAAAVFYIKQYINEKFMQIALIVVAVIFLIVGIYYIIIGVVPASI